MAMFVASGPVFANGGGPLLLYWNLFAFLFGSVFIVLIEAYVYGANGAISKANALKDSIIANLWSTLLIGFCVPLVVAAITGILSESMPSHQGLYLAVGTWVFDQMQYPNVSVAFIYVWLGVSYLLTVQLEHYVLFKRWLKRGEAAVVKVKRLCWVSNSVTYSLLLVALSLVLWLSYT
ncbi:hypothetical protein [Thiosocius teredinicola]|uniref:hypothetical protein n=1 Tax=Thiosocius teredinicola TaxID=1973002 RepID=UPI0013DE0104